jgi:hypothetical protein
MKATVEIPDTLYRRIKARSALDGRTVRDVTIELYERWLAESGPAGAPDELDRPSAAATWIRRWTALDERLGAEPADQRTTRDILITDRRA